MRKMREPMTLTYQQAASDLFATGTVPSGYKGGRTDAGWHFDAASGKTLAVHAHGYCTESIPRAADVKEAIWLLLNHPMAKGRIIVKAHRV